MRKRFYETGDPTYLAYTFYGNANLQVVADRRCRRASSSPGVQLRDGRAGSTRVRGTPPATFPGVHVRQDLERAQPRGVIEDLRRHHQFVRAGAADEGLDARLTVSGEPTTAQDSAWASIAFAVGSSCCSIAFDRRRQLVRAGRCAD